MPDKEIKTKEGGEEFLAEVLKATKDGMNNFGSVAAHALIWSREDPQGNPVEDGTCTFLDLRFGFIDNETKETASQFMREFCYKHGAFCIAFVSEVWFVQATPEQAANYKGGSLEFEPGRIEAVAVNFEHNKLGRKFYIGEILRTEGKGRIEEFKEVPCDQMTGRMARFLPAYSAN